MNLPPDARVIIGRTNEPNHSPGESVLLVEMPGLEIEAGHNELSGDYILHGSLVRRPKARLHVRVGSCTAPRRRSRDGGELGEKGTAVAD